MRSINCITTTLHLLLIKSIALFRRTCALSQRKLGSFGARRRLAQIWIHPRDKTSFISFPSTTDLHVITMLAFCLKEAATEQLSLQITRSALETPRHMLQRAIACPTGH